MICLKAGSVFLMGTRATPQKPDVADDGTKEGKL